MSVDVHRGYLTENVGDSSALKALAEANEGAVRHHVCQVCGQERPGVTRVSFRSGTHVGGHVELNACGDCRARNRRDV